MQNLKLKFDETSFSSNIVKYYIVTEHRARARARRLIKMLVVLMVCFLLMACLLKIAARRLHTIYVSNKQIPKAFWD